MSPRAAVDPRTPTFFFAAVFFLIGAFVRVRVEFVVVLVAI